MKSCIFTLSASAAIASTLMLAGCGGGTDSIDTAGASTLGSTMQSASIIHSGNANDVAAQISDAAGAGLLNAAMTRLYSAMDKSDALSLLAARALSYNLECNGGGTATITLNVRRPDRLSSGDSVSINASDCVQDNDRANGTITVNFDNITGKPSSNSVWNGAMTLNFSDFSFENSVAANTVNGNLALTINQTAPRVATFDLNSNSLQLRRDQGGTVTERTLSDFSTTGSLNSNVLTYRTNFTLAGNNFPRIQDGSYTVRTTTDFVQQKGSSPTQGALTVTASDNSSLNLTALANSNVNVVVDQNGDGTPEQNLTTTWDELKKMI